MLAAELEATPEKKGGREGSRPPLHTLALVSFSELYTGRALPLESPWNPQRIPAKPALEPFKEGPTSQVALYSSTSLSLARN